jgi:hypothetical protein
MKITTLLIAFVLVIFCLVGFGTSDDHPFLVYLQKKVGFFNDKYPQEKIYVSLDKPFYKPGEDIWYSVFLTDARHHKASSQSDVVYVEWIDTKGNVAVRQVHHAEHGIAKGDIHLDESLPGGIYRLRAYTQWMKNFGEKSFFNKEVQIQKVITPRMLMKLDFERESYGTGEEVQAKFEVSNLRNEPLENLTIRYSVHLAGKKVLEAQSVTDVQGKVTIRFTLPTPLSTADGLLTVFVDDHGISESISRAIPIMLNKIDLQFFPEGGDLIEDIEGKLAFKALNEFGKAADVEGDIVDEKGMVQTHFKSFHMGMGAVSFTPREGHVYSAVIQQPVGSTIRYAIPKAVKGGYRIHVQENLEHVLKLNIYAPKKEMTHIVLQVRGDILYAESIMMDPGDHPLNIDVKNMPPGMAVITMFDGNGEPRSERLVFINKHKGLKVKIETDKKEYQPREKVIVKMKTTDNEGKPVPAHLALSVVDDQVISFADDKQDNIVSYLLMTSDLKGEVQEPSFYFKDDEPQAKEALDYVMMTHGWRRFTWKEVFLPSKPLTYMAEKNGSISGVVRNRFTAEGRAAEVTLIELDNKKRLIKVKADKHGRFTFSNIDPSASTVLLAAIPWHDMDRYEIVLDAQRFTPTGDRHSSSTPSLEGKIDLPEEIMVEAEEVAAREFSDKAENAPSDAVAVEHTDMDVSMKADVSQLNEVVITGYGVEQKSLGACVVRIPERDIELASYPSVEKLLMGRVAGLVITPQGGNVGNQHAMSVRGINSILTTQGEPLYMVDGLPIGSSLSYNFSNAGFISPMDISSLQVMSGPQAVSLYGSAASQGVFIIATKSKLYYPYPQINHRKFIVHQLVQRSFAAPRTFYSPVYTSMETSERSDFRSTIYWNGDVTTDDRGEATLSFYNSDATTAFRITAEGVSTQGDVGRAEEVYHTLLPLSIDAKIPSFLMSEDTLKIPVILSNHTSAASEVSLSWQLPSGLRCLQKSNASFIIEAHQSKTVFVPIVTEGIPGTYPIKLIMKTPSYQDEVNQNLTVKALGFPVKMSVYAKQKDKAIQFELKDIERGSARASVTLFTDVLAEVSDGLQSILSEPHGCFEQVSATTYPNVLVLRFLKESGRDLPAVEKKARGYIKDGYKKLKAYEINSGGFEWFGHPPAHEGLTAYGLLEFMDMQKVYDGVSTPMMKRTRDWLLSRRQKDGTFKQSQGKYDWFSRSSREVTNAYLTYALAEAGERGLDKEYQYALSHALADNDFYRLALCAHTAFLIGEKYDYERLMTLFKSKVAESGLDKLPAAESITRSYGQSLRIETAAWWALALLRSPSPDVTTIVKIVEYLKSQRSYGMYGSTQGTVLTLKVFIEYTKLSKSMKDDGAIEVFVNGKNAVSRSYDASSTQPVHIDHLETYMSEGKQNVQVSFKETEDPLPYTVDVMWHTRTPQSHENCKLLLETHYADHVVSRNETVRLTIVLKNKTSEGLPMSMAVIGIPSGLSLQPWQLKELQEKKMFDYYELQDQYLVLYYTSMKPSETKEILLDVKAEIPGTYQAPASSAYLYYTREFRYWLKGDKINVMP